jgi:hypothetical protein
MTMNEFMEASALIQTRLREDANIIVLCLTRAMNCVTQIATGIPRRRGRHHPELDAAHSTASSGATDVAQMRRFGRSVCAA